MFTNIILYIVAGFVVLHGLIHLMGFVTYWKLAEIEGLVYKTTVLGGRWDLGESGIRLYGTLWLVAAVGFIIAAYGLVTHQAWWRPAMLGVTIFSLLITGLDWSNAYMGVIINLIILAALLLVPFFVSPGF